MANYRSERVAVNLEPEVVTNPWTFLEAEERNHDGQAQEALFLTYNADLSFFESRLLGVCRSAGARVTVLADAKAWAPNPRALTRAGRDYHVSLVAVAQAFHPKLVVLAGPRRTVVALGSGNLTLGGWQYNSELWTVWTGSQEGTPAVIAEVATFLHQLTDVVPDRFSGDAVRRCLGALDQASSETPTVETAQRLVSSLRRPIIEQLPRGPVDELSVYAPFYDPECSALAALVERFSPQRVKVVIQPGRTVIEAPALEQFAANCRVPVEVLFDSPGTEDWRYRHGKLIEWTRRGKRLALTGSPNISRAALMSTPRNGNVELGVISEISASLLPTSHPAGPGEVPTHRVGNVDEDERQDANPAPLLLAAVLSVAGLQLTLSSPAVKHLTLQASPPAANRDTWEDLAVIPAGDASPVLPVHPVAGTRVRVTDLDEELRPSVGPALTVSDPNQVLRRASHQGRSRTADVSGPDIFGADLSILRALWADIERLAADVSATATPRLRAPEGVHTSGHSGLWSDSDLEPWFWERELAAEHHGPGLASLGLGLPHIPSDVTSPLEFVESLSDEDDAALEADSAEEVDADEAIRSGLVERSEVVLNHRSDPAALREERQKWCGRATEYMPRLPLTSRMTVLRIILVFWSAGNWPEGDLRPIRLTADAVAALEHGPRSDELSRRIGSLIALTLTMVHDRVDLTSSNEGALLYRHLCRDYAYLAIEQSEDALQEFCRSVGTPATRPILPEDVKETVARLLDDDPLTEPISVLEAEGLEVTRPNDRTVMVSGAFRNPEAVALRALALLEGHEPIGTWAVNQSGQWAFLAWRRPDLVRVTPLQQGCRWRHQVLSPLLDPASLHEDRMQSEGLRGERRHVPQNQPFDEALDLLEILGVANPPLPPI